MAAVQPMHRLIRNLCDGRAEVRLEGTWTLNEWNGADLTLPGGDRIRFDSTDDWDEPVNVRRLTANGVHLWTATFPAQTPTRILRDFVYDMIKAGIQ